jgi:hypothetical protein
METNRKIEPTRLKKRKTDRNKEDREIDTEKKARSFEM